MDLDEYQNKALETAGLTGTDEYLLSYSALGLTGEAGEFAELIKKHVYHKHPLDKDHAKKELGDALWYIAFAARRLGLTMDDIGQTNITKLKARYPNGYNQADSMAKKDEAA